MKRGIFFKPVTSFQICSFTFRKDEKSISQHSLGASQQKQLDKILNVATSADKSVNKALLPPLTNLHRAVDAFKKAIESSEEIGTITCWSNNAEICSYPKTLQDNKLPSDIDAFSAELQQKHQASYPEIPTGVGFCMLVTKQAKNQVGYLDEQTFGHGYGEENDYSLRVKQAGLRNVLCDNVYVAHVGNQSFKDLDLKPDQSTMNRLLAKHPEYAKLISEFIETDALASLRESIIAKIDHF